MAIIGVHERVTNCQRAGFGAVEIAGEVVHAGADGRGDLTLDRDDRLTKSVDASFGIRCPCP
jgi:hypothetical protein